jgi:hypothetical protein
MSAADPLKLRRGRLRGSTLRGLAPREPGPPDGSDPRPSPRATLLKCSYRPADADFFCWKYGVWYNLMDCCYRHARQTYTGCAGCGQGRSNLRENRREFLSLRIAQDRRATR